MVKNNKIEEVKTEKEKPVEKVKGRVLIKSLNKKYRAGMILPDKEYEQMTSRGILLDVYFKK